MASSNTSASSMAIDSDNNLDWPLVLDVNLLMFICIEPDRKKPDIERVAAQMGPFYTPEKIKLRLNLLKKFTFLQSRVQAAQAAARNFQPANLPTEREMNKELAGWVEPHDGPSRQQSEHQIPSGPRYPDHFPWEHDDWSNSHNYWRHDPQQTTSWGTEASRYNVTNDRHSQQNRASHSQRPSRGARGQRGSDHRRGSNRNAISVGGSGPGGPISRPGRQQSPPVARGGAGQKQNSNTQKQAGHVQGKSSKGGQASGPSTTAKQGKRPLIGLEADDAAESSNRRDRSRVQSLFGVCKVEKTVQTNREAPKQNQGPADESTDDDSDTTSSSDSQEANSIAGPWSQQPAVSQKQNKGKMKAEIKKSSSKHQNVQQSTATQGKKRRASAGPSSERSSEKKKKGKGHHSKKRSFSK